MHRLRTLPKIDLHRHLTGSIDASTAVKIAAKYRLHLPTYIVTDLDQQLFGKRKLADLEEYFGPWEVLNGLFVNADATREIVLESIRQAAEDNVVYAEFRTGPRGFLGPDRSDFPFEEFLAAVSSAAAEAEVTYGVMARFLVGIPRHVFGPISKESRTRMYAGLISVLNGHSQFFVGVDLNGLENAFPTAEFKSCFDVAKANGFPVTVHAGECGPASNVATAVRDLHAVRIGHGVAAAQDSSVLDLLAQRHCLLRSARPAMKCSALSVGSRTYHCDDSRSVESHLRFVPTTQLVARH